MMNLRTCFAVVLTGLLLGVGPDAIFGQDPSGPFIPTPVRSASGAMWSIPPQVPHLIVRGPQLHRQTETAGRENDPIHDHGRLTVDGAVVDPVWRQPYAYGYFGALPNRHWKRHYGYHGSYTQWTFK